MTREQAEIKLHSLFGIEHFYDEQWEVINKLLHGERVLLIERTGFGKSLCYQFPATQFQYTTIIFSPLIALMRDQVRSLNCRGIKAACINSEQPKEENTAIIQDAINGKLKILYIAPERQENIEWKDAMKKMRISMIVIDEAHTISIWGHDFRPAFRRIIELVQFLPQNAPVLATTATATKKVQKDIETQMKDISFGISISVIRGSLNRPNFQLYVIRVKAEEQKMLWLAEHLTDIEGNGLIYTGTRTDTFLYAKWLDYNGIKAIDYNAGHDAETRRQIEKELMDNKWKCVVSTNALGMGLDKSDIRFIIHTQIPASPIHYYQEIGRAGRDGKPATIILFYNENIAPGCDDKSNHSSDVDYQLPLSFIETARPNIQKYEKVIGAIKEEELTETQLMIRCNLKQTEIRTIRADLIEQKIISERQISSSKKVYSYKYNAPLLDFAEFEHSKQTKLRDLQSMIDYVYTSEPRMKFLCSFLDSTENTQFNNCDNTNLRPFIYQQNPIFEKRLTDFREEFFPILECKEVFSKLSKILDTKFKVSTPWPNIFLVERKKDGSTELFEYHNAIRYQDFNIEEQDLLHEAYEKWEKGSHITDGYAASYYGDTNIGSAIHRSKYEHGGDFPNFLLRRTLSIFGKKYKGIKFDLMLYVPPTKSGNLVKTFAEKFAKVVNIPLQHTLIKQRETKEQKIFQNKKSKALNVENAFTITSNVTGKTILLFDDIYDSGETLKSIGMMLTQKGAKWIIPITIAKTIGGTL